MQPIYFDNNATTQIYPPILQELNNIFALPLNSSSIHSLGQKSQQIVENSRQNIKTNLNGNNYEIFFTSSATEANNTIISGTISELNLGAIFYSAIEHESVYNFCTQLASEQKNKDNKIEFIEIEVDENGLINLANLGQKIAQFKAKSNKQFLASIMLANNQNGVIQPIKEIGKIVHQNFGFLHCDLAQAIGKIKVDLEDLNPDFATISGHKFYAMQGVGVILARKGLDFKPIFYGGGQEQFKRPGTINIAAVHSIGLASNFCNQFLLKMTEIASLRNYLESEMQQFAQKSSGNKLIIFSQKVPRLPNSCYFAVENSPNQHAIIHFDLHNICLSIGSACSSGKVEQSRILKAMKIGNNFVNSAIRISLGIYNQSNEIEEFLLVWKKFYQKYL